MNCKLITTASDYSKTEMLRKSLDKYEWPYHIIVHEWNGFMGKISETYNYLMQNPDITHFFYSDSYDTIVLDTMENTIKKIKDFDCIIMSAERACYPHPEKAVLYPECESPFKYVNGGGWFCNAEVFKIAVRTNNLALLNDQVFFTDLYLNHPEYVKLDYNCEVFQTIAFCPDDNFRIWEMNDFDIVHNTVTKTYPTFFHGNGHTPMTEFYKLI